MKKSTLLKSVSLYFISILALSPAISLALVLPTTGGNTSTIGNSPVNSIPGINGGNSTVFAPVNTSTNIGAGAVGTNTAGAALLNGTSTTSSGGGSGGAS